MYSVGFRWFYIQTIQCYPTICRKSRPHFGNLSGIRKWEARCGFLPCQSYTYICVRRWLIRPTLARNVHLHKWQGMSGSFPGGLRVRAFLACIFCSSAAVLLDSHNLMHRGMPNDSVACYLFPGVRDYIDWFLYSFQILSLQRLF